MSFNSFLFLLVFLPATLIVYWLLRKNGPSKSSVYFLCVASIGYYVLAFPKGIVTFLLSLIVNYMVAYEILKGREKNARSKSLAFGVVFDVIVLAFFKYGGFIWPQVGTELVAPGISFYTFCEIALLVECYRGTVEKLTFEEYFFLMTFFPKITEGPIVRPGDILTQKRGKERLNGEEIYRIIMLFVFGLFKKVIIAETLRKAVDFGFADLNSMHSGEALVIMLSYTLQIYFDFSGYTDMARALAMAFGFELPINFDSPYKAKNICDFWKRWHITLTTFFTRYIYIPLGGNRRGKARMYMNFLIIFLVSGLWHGAGIQFVIWGMLHGVLFVVTRMVLNATEGLEIKRNRVTDSISVVLTFIYVSVAWVFFRAPSLSSALGLFKDLGQCWFPRFNIGLAKCFNLDELWYVLKVLHLDGFKNSIYILMVLLLALLCILVFWGKSAADYAKKCKINMFNTLLVTGLLVWSILSFEGVATYIYVNF